MRGADEIQVRPARLQDLSALLALENEFPGDRLSLRSWRRLLHSPSAWIAVVEGGGHLLGNGVLLFRRGSRWARLYSMVVAPKARGRGLAQHLLLALEAESQQRGALGLRLEVRADNEAARRLYARRGYREIQPLPGYYEDGADGFRYERRFSVGS